jgi:hypothetical protein
MAVAVTAAPWALVRLRPASAARAYGFLRALRLAHPTTLYRRGLKESGWRRSNAVGRPVDKNGSPLPWYSYGASRFIESRLPADAVVFEFGCGNSTLWYASRAVRVISVEDHASWAASIANVAPSNADVLVRVEEAAFVQSVREPGIAFDVIVIDSQRWREACAAAAVPRLSERGVVIWDNAERTDFRAAWDAGIFAGFRELPFHGLGPCSGVMWTTSVLYRDGNCLGI